jgi:hypothetical protein
MELVEDEQARLQAVEKMIDLFAGAGQIAPADSLGRAQLRQDAGVEMRQVGPLPGLDPPEPLPVDTAQVFDGEAAGDHGFDVVIGTGDQQAAWTQRRRPAAASHHVPLRHQDGRSGICAIRVEVSASRSAELVGSRWSAIIPGRDWKDAAGSARLRSRIGRL